MMEIKRTDPSRCQSRGRRAEDHGAASDINGVEPRGAGARYTVRV